jgi:hypothetical protein
MALPPNIEHDLPPGLSNIDPCAAQHHHRDDCNRVTLPPDCGLPTSESTIPGDDASTKQKAENRAAYAALVKLHNKGWVVPSSSIRIRSIQHNHLDEIDC